MTGTIDSRRPGRAPPATVLIALAALLGGCGSSNDDGGNDGDFSALAQGDSLGLAEQVTGIMGAWQGECLPDSAGGGSERHILAIDDTVIAEDYYRYDSLDCSGVPRGQAFPLRLYAYVTGSLQTTDSGLAALPLDLTVSQLSDNAVVRDGATLGQARFGLVALDSLDTLRFTGGAALDAASRPTDFAVPWDVYRRREPLTVSVTSIDDLVGYYTGNCDVRSDGENSERVTYDIRTDSADSTTDLYFNRFCVGTPSMRVVTPRAVVPGPGPITTLFGDTALPVYFYKYAQRIEFGEEYNNLPPSGESESYTLLALVDGDALMFGDCVARTSDCKSSIETAADMIDFEYNNDTRFRRSSGLPEPDIGSSDTSAIAGLWDVSNTDTGELRYQEVSPGGTGRFLELIGTGLADPDACLGVADEAVIAYGDNVYEYVQQLDTGTGYDIFLRQFVEDGALVEVDPVSGERHVFSALAALPALPLCP